LPGENDDEPQIDVEKGPEVTCGDITNHENRLENIVARQNVTDRSTVAVVPVPSMEAWSASIPCPGSDDDDEEEQPQQTGGPAEDTTPAGQDTGVALDVGGDGGVTPGCAAAGTCRPSMSAVITAGVPPSIEEEVDDSNGAAGDEPDGAGSAYGGPAAKAARTAPAPNSTSNSRTGETSAPGWSVQACLTTGMDVGGVLGYGTGTTSSTGDVRSRSDTPLTPPG
jgi:hypothetical protein